MNCIKLVLYKTQLWRCHHSDHGAMLILPNGIPVMLTGMLAIAAWSWWWANDLWMFCLERKENKTKYICSFYKTICFILYWDMKYIIWYWFFLRRHLEVKIIYSQKLILEDCDTEKLNRIENKHLLKVHVLFFKI